MAYSRHVQTVLEREKVKVAERIAVTKAGKTFEGLLMPRPEIGDPDSLVIKLDSGYNIGIRVEKGVKVEKSRHKEPKAVREEEEFELGKVGKKLLTLKFDKRKPPVSLLSTGGTIASRVDYRTGGVTGAMKPEEILHNIPELANFVNVTRMHSVFNKMSEDMDPQDWIELAKAVYKELNSDTRGVVITHGTDTLHYTSAALSFFLKGLNKPVVLTGAQRSSDRGSSDAGMNILCSFHAANSDIAEVGVCMHGSMNDSCCLFTRGTKVRKMDAQRRDAFRPINDLPLARIRPDGTIENVKEDFNRRNGNKPGLDARFEEKVAMVKAYPGADPHIIDYHIKRGMKGIVVETTGLGHVPTFARKSWIKTIAQAVKSGIPIVTAPQTLYGRINPNVYTNLRVLYHEAGAICGQDMLPETAFVKLGYVLAKTRKMEEIRKLMATNLAGEITERTLPQTFLY